MSTSSNSEYGTIITTGTGAGLGTSIALKLVSSSTANTHNIFTVRPSQDTSSPSYQSIKQAIAASAKPSNNEIVHLALDDLSNVRAFAADINGRVSSGALPRLKTLILNAGVQIVGEPQMTKDGYETTFQVNYLANFLLVLLLLPSFGGVGPESTTSDVSTAGRIIFISSDSQDPTRAKGFPAQHWPSDSEGISSLWHPKSTSTNLREVGMGRYAMSKVCLAMFMFSLQRRLDTSQLYSNITALSIDPGWMATNLLRDSSALTRFGILPFLKIGPYIGKFMGEIGSQLRTADASAEHVIDFTIGERQSERPKAWFVVHGKKGLAGELSRDKVKQEVLWTESVKLLGLTDTVVPDIELGGIKATE